MDGNDDDDNNNNQRNQRPRLGAAQQPPLRQQPADGLINQIDETWMQRQRITALNLRVNSSETAQVRGIDQIFNPPVFPIGGADSDSDEDGDDLGQDWLPTLVILSDLVAQGLNYDGQFRNNTIGYITKIKLVSNVQVSAYQRGNNQGNRRQQVVTGQQRIITFICPQSTAGQNVFVIIQERSNSILFSNDTSQRDSGSLRKYLSLL